MVPGVVKDAPSPPAEQEFVLTGENVGLQGKLGERQANKTESALCEYLFTAR